MNYFFGDGLEPPASKPLMLTVLNHRNDTMSSIPGAVSSAGRSHRARYDQEPGEPISDLETSRLALAGASNKLFHRWV